MNAVKKGSMSMRKPCKEESAELTVGEFVSPPYMRHHLYAVSNWK